MKQKRKEITIKQGEEIVIVSGSKKFIIRGTLNTLQVFGKDYLTEKADKIFGGTTQGVVIGTSFSIGYEKDIVATIPVLKI
jgi:hypothetical protein